MSDSVRAVFESAERAFQQGSVAQAESLCTEILNQSPNHAPATLLLGLSLVRQERAGEAVDVLRRALTLSPNDFLATTWLQVALRKEGRLDEAVDLGETARRRWPGDAEVLVNLSHAYLGIGDLQSAVECLAEASAANPRNVGVRLRHGIALERIGKDEDAANEFRRVVSLDPTVEDSYVRLGRLLISHGNFTQAVELGRKGLKILPRSAQIHLLVAQAHRNLRDIGPAEKHLGIAMSLDPEIVVTAAMWRQEDGDFAGSAELYEKAIHQRPVQGVAYFGLVKGRKITPEDRGLIDRMEANLAEPRLPPSERAALHYALGKALADLGDYEGSMRHYDRGNDANFEIHISGKGYDPERLVANREKIVRMFTPDLMERHRGSGSESNVPIFIIGMIRSGTTLLEQIVASHPDVGGAGEQRFWVNEVPAIVDLEAGTLDPDRLAEARDRYLEVLRSFQPDSPRITDKMPMNFYCAGVIHLAYPKSPILHIRRNPLDTVLSIYTTDLARPPEFAHNRRNIVSEYRNYLAMMEHWRKVIPPTSLFEINYEDLVADQETWTRKVLEFCGLEWDPRCLDFYSNDRPVSTPSAWQVRQPIYRSSVERWRRYEPWLGEFAELQNIPLSPLGERGKG